MCALSGELTINLTALQENYKILDRMTGGSCRVAAAVKADAYGLGMEACAPALYEAGARAFFVALMQEGIALRGVLPEAEIYVLHGFLVKDAKEYKAHKLIPVLNSLDEIQNFQKFGGSCVLHFDTGMNRLGIPADEVLNVADHLKGLDVLYVMSHFANSDEKDSLFNEQQAARFSEVSKSFPTAKKSLANSSGIFRSADYHLDMVRAGLALYGGNPTPEQENPMRDVVSLSVPVLQIHSARKGETAGYNQTYRFESDTHLAIASLGYADGFLRSLSNNGVLYWKGYKLPIRGRVSMDLVICDLMNVPESDYPNSGDMVEVIGKHQSIDALARAAGTISYEILTTACRGRQRRQCLGI